MEILKRKDLDIKYYEKIAPPFPICKECEKKQWLTYKLIVKNSITTLMAYMKFMDETGGVHHHNDNEVTKDYECSNGHKFSVSSGHSCECGWESTYLKKQRIRNK